MLSPVVAGALREAMRDVAMERIIADNKALAKSMRDAKEALCDWCQRPFDKHKPRYAWDGEMFCSKACRELDQENA